MNNVYVKSMILGLLLSASCLFTVANAALILNIDSNGQLTGAQNVDVDGALYNVEFLDGTCIALFSGCDSRSDFTFTSSSAATAASNALFNSVFLDSALGLFDSNPALTAGCSIVNLCGAYTPYHVTANGRVSNNVAINTPGSDQTLKAFPPANWNSKDSGTTVYAKWNLATSIPEPGTVMLLSLGIAGLAFSRSKKKT